MKNLIWLISLLIFITSSNAFAQTVAPKTQIGFPFNIIPIKIGLAEGSVAAESTVQVQLKVDERGNVIAASAVSGYPLIRAAATSAARKVKFTPTTVNGKQTPAEGFIKYYFQLWNANSISYSLCAVDEKCDTAELKNRHSLRFSAINTGVINSRAKSLEKPQISPEVKAVLRRNHIVTVRVLVVSASGKIFAAGAVSGLDVLRQPAVEAALKSTFNPANINGAPEIYVSGLIVYRIPCENCKSK